MEMPIQCSIQVVVCPSDEFHRIDYEVMGIAFDVQNELGCLCEEKIYEREIEARCLERGMDARSEVPVCVTHGSFEKTYLLDLVVERRVLYELKATASFTPRHRQQILNYLFLTNLQHGKLVNMRPPSVEFEFVSNVVPSEDRYRFNIDARAWVDLDEHSTWIRELVAALLEDWGAFLDVQLFYDAVEHLRPQRGDLTGPVPVRVGGRAVGQQNTHLLNADTALCLTALKRARAAHEDHLLRFLSHTSLRAIQWINFCRHEITMKTLRNRSVT